MSTGDGLRRSSLTDLDVNEMNQIQALKREVENEEENVHILGSVEGLSELSMSSGDDTDDALNENEEFSTNLLRTKDGGNFITSSSTTRKKSIESKVTKSTFEIESGKESIDALVVSESDIDIEDGSDDKNSKNGKDFGELSESLKAKAYLAYPYHRLNLAITMSYFIIGFAMSFTRVPCNYYAIHVLNATPAEQNVLTTMTQLPWSFKLLYGLLSDCVPVCGKRRKPYFILGWIFFIMANLLLASMVTPGIQALVFLSFLSVAGYMMSDVMCDALIVERSRYESASNKGNFQAVGYTCRFAGNIIGSILGTILYNKDDWGWGLQISQIFVINGLSCVFFVCPFIYNLLDEHHFTKTRSLNEQCYDIWRTVQLKAIWRPLCFVYIYNALQIQNPTWNEFLVDGLKFTNWMLGVLGIAGSIFSWLGIIAYRKFFCNVSWRNIYIWTTLIVMFFTIFQILLIFRVNVKWGINDLAFSLGDDAIASFVASVQFLPIVKMYLGLCPEGAEGTTYAMLTTFSNMASAVGQSIGTAFTKIWEVSPEAIQSGNFTGVWKLTVLTSVLQPCGLILIYLLPKNTHHQIELQRSVVRSKFFGGLFLIVLFVSLIWTLSTTFYVLFNPEEEEE